MNFREINILGNIINDGWGQISGESDLSSGSFKIISKITGEDRLRITCMVVTNLLDRREMQIEASKVYDQLNKACNERLKAIKKDFKTNAGRALKTKELGHDSSVELMNYNPHIPKGTSLIRCVYNFEIK